MSTNSPAKPYIEGGSALFNPKSGGTTTNDNSPPMPPAHEASPSQTMMIQVEDPSDCQSNSGSIFGAERTPEHEVFVMHHPEALPGTVPSRRRPSLPASMQQPPSHSNSPPTAGVAWARPSQPPPQVPSSSSASQISAHSSSIASSRQSSQRGGFFPPSHPNAPATNSPQRLSTTQQPPEVRSASSEGGARSPSSASVAVLPVDENGQHPFWAPIVKPALTLDDDGPTRRRKVLCILLCVLTTVVCGIFGAVLLNWGIRSSATAAMTVLSVSCLVWAILNCSLAVVVTRTQRCHSALFTVYLLLWLAFIILVGLSLSDLQLPIGTAAFLLVILVGVNKCIDKRIVFGITFIAFALEIIFSLDGEFDWGISTALPDGRGVVVSATVPGFHPRGLQGDNRYKPLLVIIRVLWALALASVSIVVATISRHTSLAERRHGGNVEFLFASKSLTNALLSFDIKEARRVLQQLHRSEMLHENDEGNSELDELKRGIIDQWTDIVDVMNQLKGYVPQSVLADTTPIQNMNTITGTDSEKPFTEEELESIGTPGASSSEFLQSPTHPALAKYAPGGSLADQSEGSINLSESLMSSSAVNVPPSPHSPRSPQASSFIHSHHSASGLSPRSSNKAMVHLSHGMTPKRVTVLCFNINEFHSIVKRGIDLANRVQKDVLSVISAHVKHHKGIIDHFQGDHIFVTFNAAGNAAAHAKKAALTALGVIEEVQKTFTSPSIRVTAGLSTGVAAVGTMGTEDMKRLCIVGPVIAQSMVLERLTKVYDGVNCLAPGSALSDIGFECFYQAIDVLALPGSKPSIIASIEGLKSTFTAGINTEWMYQLAEDERADPFAHVNAAFLAAVDGDADSAQRCLEARSARTTTRSKIGENQARELIRQLREGYPFLGTDLGLFYDRIAPSSIKQEFSITHDTRRAGRTASGNVSTPKTAGSTPTHGTGVVHPPGLPNATTTNSGSKDKDSGSASTSASGSLHNFKDIAGRTHESNRSSISSTVDRSTRDMLEVSAGNLTRLLTPRAKSMSPPPQGSTLALPEQQPVPLDGTASNLGDMLVSPTRRPSEPSLTLTLPPKASA